MNNSFYKLPPRWHLNLERLNHSVNALPRGKRYAIEFRDHTWHTPEVYRLLERHDIAWCVYDLEGFTSLLLTTAEFVYARLHGPVEKYRGRYEGRLLSMWERRFTSWMAKGLDVYVYFDNDIAAAAVLDALKLRRQYIRPAAAAA